jgi:hypothetical protein
MLLDAQRAALLIESVTHRFMKTPRQMRHGYSVPSHLGATHVLHEEAGVLELDMELGKPDALRGVLRGAAAEQPQVRHP